MAYAYSTEPRPVWLQTAYPVQYTFPAWNGRAQTYYGQTFADAREFSLSVAENGGVALESFGEHKLWGAANVPTA